MVSRHCGCSAARPTLTRPGEGVAGLMEDLSGGGGGGFTEVDRLHGLIHRIRERVAYETGTTDVGTTAEQALAQGQGGLPGPCPTSSLPPRGAWACRRAISAVICSWTMSRIRSPLTPGRKSTWSRWAGSASTFPNGISPDERYVRLAVGLDYRCAMPVSGIRTGQGSEELAVHISVQQ